MEQMSAENHKTLPDSRKDKTQHILEEECHPNQLHPDQATMESTLTEQPSTECHEIPTDSLDGYARFMRRELCPPEMVDGFGYLRQEYFQPRKDLTDGVLWSDEAEEKLYSGIETYGIGKWSLIRQYCLMHWDELAIKLKTCLLVGAHDLSPYEGQRYTKVELDALREKNLTLARESGTLRSHVRVVESLLSNDHVVNGKIDDRSGDTPMTGSSTDQEPQRQESS